jgi:hypothetical protein
MPLITDKDKAFDTDFLISNPLVKTQFQLIESQQRCFPSSRKIDKK